VLISTDVAGMGIDTRDLNFSVNIGKLFLIGPGLGLGLGLSV
jgi:hypothetical protein